MTRFANYTYTICTLITLTLLTACQSTSQQEQSHAKHTTTPSVQKYPNIQNQHLSIVEHAERHATGKAKKILSQARIMTLTNREIIQGSCWDYIHAVYNRAGVPMAQREVVFKGKYGQKPYAKSEQIQAGDWLYYVNHQYKNVEHSGLFIGWVDRANKQALMLSYAGQGKKATARYKVYDLSSVYHIMRAKSSS
ncbi:MAG: NlpC/P60 family protein [Acinetobacter sp.]|nr:NlpC/P60 family protein [Acinetobacter sp.]